ncbi:MAG: sensor histidine kinase [Verrucomicrobiales bacterium]
MATITHRQALKITLVYAVVAVLWIYLSDHALAAIVQDPQLVLRWSVHKGIAFVLCTAFLIQLLIGRAFRAIELSEASLRLQTVQLERLNRSLEFQVAEQTAELKDALNHAQSADRMKSSFLATMSHELRTPLNSIIGFTGILVKGLAGDLNAEQRKQLEMVQASARHLLNLINDVLDLSKIEAGQLQIHVEPFAIAESITTVADLMRPAIDGKGLNFEVQMENDIGNMVSDPRRFQQIVLNLLSNAVKFTDAGDVILSIERVEAYQRQPDQPGVEAVRIRITDTGIGIQEKDLKYLFLPFSQIDSGLTRQHEGTGLGLAICRRLTDLLHGEVFAKSIPGEGSTFTAILPLVIAPLEIS